MTLYIGNLSYQVTDQDLREVLSEYGQIRRLNLPVDRETGRMRGFAFVEMSDDGQEDAAIDDLNGADWMGRSLKVNRAKPRDSRS